MMDGLQDFDEVKTAPEQHTGNNNYRSNNGGSKKPKRNIIGKAEINLWDDPEIEPMKLETDDFKDDVKIATFALPSDSYKLSPAVKYRIIDMLKLLKDKDYKIRFVVGYTAQMEEELKEIFGKENLIYIIPFANYRVNVDNETPLYLVTDKNIKVAAEYVGNKRTGKGFNNYPTMAKYSYAAVIGSLYGPDVDEPSEFYFTYDPFIGNGKDIDFTKSRNTANYFFLAKNLPYTMYNLADEASYADLEQVLL